MICHRRPLFIILIAFAFLAGCSNDVKEIESENTATFLVSQLSASSELVPNSIIPAIKEANFFHFKACLKDSIVQAAIVGEKFQVEHTDRVETLTTDAEGCLVWSKAIIFNWLAEESWIEQEVVISAKGHQLGMVKIPFYVNPWLDGSNSLVDTRYQNVAGPITNSSSNLKATLHENSPLALSNISWNVVRRRTRGAQTVLEWRFSAAPLISRKDIAGQIKQEALASGRGTIELKLSGRDIRGLKSEFQPFINQTLRWQNGLIQFEGELLLTNEQLPKLGDLSHLVVDFKLPNNLAQVQGILPLSTIEQGNAPELLSVNQDDEQEHYDFENVQDVIGSLNISNINLAIENDDIDGYLLDQNLQLSLTKTFRLEFKPTVILPGANVMGMTPTPLTQGKLDLKIHFFSANRSGLNFEKPNLADFTHIASDQIAVKVRPDGLVSSLIKLPMAISTTPLLRLRTLVIIEAIPSESIERISPQTISAQVYPLAPQNQVTAYEQVDEHVLPNAKQTDRRGLMARLGEGVNSLKIALQEYSSSMGHDFSQRSLTDLLNTKTNPVVNSLAGTSNLTMADFRILMSSRNLPKTTVAKLCSAFFPIASYTREFAWGRFKDGLKGGEQWQKCLAEPQNYIKTSPSDHLEEFLQENKIGDISVTKPNFVSQARGDIFRGVGFFAAFGDRSSEGDGERTASTIETHLGFELTVPFIASAGVGLDRSHSVYQAREKAQMQSSFERHYTQQKDIELEYNRITLEFLARMRRCVTASSEQAKKTILICEDNDRLTKMQESWYFVGDTRLHKAGVITNSTVPGESEMAQVIRGDAAFKKIWGEFRDEDRVLILEKLDEPAQGILQKPLSEQLVTGEKVIGVGFPGVIIPY